MLVCWRSTLRINVRNIVSNDADDDDDNVKTPPQMRNQKIVETKMTLNFLGFRIRAEKKTLESKPLI